jgi:(1->4)-alpha-D-glucan 1-alpha-D-glucosylmutase
MHIPSATYRVQLHKGFTFRDLDKIIDYLHLLGISTIYAAPIFNATPGSMHGYDVIDPHAINPEIGTFEELISISKKLKAKDMYWLQDIVPNHMAFNTLNHRLMDVLERGNQSPFYHYFDINWDHHNPSLNGKLGVPFLGKDLIRCIRDGEIMIGFSEKGFTVDYFHTQYPLSTQAINALMQFTNDESLKKHFKEYIYQVQKAPTYDHWKNFKTLWVDKLLQERQLHAEISRVISLVNSNTDRLNDLLANQNYILLFWQQTETEINYRRFFTVNELICLRMEDDRVFDEYHTFLQTLFDQGIIHGLRIDHIDGLYDPSKYIRKLRERFGNNVYIIAEKILEAKETLPEHWPLEGTSGYEFLSYVNQLITDKKGARELIHFYHKLIPDQPPYQELVYQNKKLILERYMGGEWENLMQYFAALNLQNGFDADRLKHAVGLLMLSFPVYRIYPDQLPLIGNDHSVINEAFKKARLIDSSYTAELEYLQELFIKERSSENDKALHFLKRLMQFTGPLTAKGVEDTTFYVYNPLASHDEVGDTPERLAISVNEFHAKMITRNKKVPLALNATTTHDTKRGEDARTRLNVLSELPELWKENVGEWIVTNKKNKRDVNGKKVPTLNDEYFIYQALIGGFPEDQAITENWIERLKAYLIKALREAKVNSNWTTPDEEYESACSAFVQDVLHDKKQFLVSFLSFFNKVLTHASYYSVAQILIKGTAPGIPDIYQGCELFDLSFVDPDNRRPIDYDRRENFLRLLIKLEKEGQEPLFTFLKSNKNNGYEKLFVTSKVLNFRKQHPALFTDGNYMPLQIAGASQQTLAYARNNGSDWVVIVIPLAAAREKANNDLTDTYVLLPENSPNQWTNVFTNTVIESDGKIFWTDAFKNFPLLLLKNITTI